MTKRWYWQQTPNEFLDSMAKHAHLVEKAFPVHMHGHKKFYWALTFLSKAGMARFWEAQKEKYDNFVAVCQSWKYVQGKPLKCQGFMLFTEARTTFEVVSHECTHGAVYGIGIGYKSKRSLTKRLDEELATNVGYMVGDFWRQYGK
jgi:hypothetical protein